MTITGAPNKWARIQHSTDLRNWKDLSWWSWMGPEGVKQFTNYEPGQRMMFYRVIVKS